jgi:hypothetical protein
LADHYAYPGSKQFQQAVQVIAEYLADLAEAKVSSIRDAYAQTDTPLTGETVEDAVHSIRDSIETVIAARMASWGGAVTLVQQRTGKSVVVLRQHWAKLSANYAERLRKFLRGQKPIWMCFRNLVLRHPKNDNPLRNHYRRNCRGPQPY